MHQSEIAIAMTDPSFYSFPPPKVELIQTHISWIFIAGEEVFKVKKAVNFGFLDFTTLEKRKFYCEEEVRLNRRLAPQVYLGVVAISRNREGKIVLGTGETVIEYAVHMRKIPAEKMLKTLLKNPDFDQSTIAAVAGKLARFHQEADTGGKIDEMGRIGTIRFNHEENFAQTVPFIGVTLSTSSHAFIRDWARRFMTDQEELFHKRVREHRIRDCHGDLHLEHIVINDDDIIIFDCIEFNERFRFGDVAAEVAFLAMDLDFNGYAALSDLFVQSYTECSGDSEIPALIDFYKCYYAFVRGKVTGFQLNDPHLSAKVRQDVTQTASRYFDLALSCAARFAKPTLIIMSGLMGSGKSVVARELSRLTGALTIKMDVIRKELLEIPVTEHRLDDFGQGIYSDDITGHVYGKALEKAASILGLGKSVIIDASYKKKEHRLAARDLAADLKADFFIVECVCPDSCARSRLETRMKVLGEASDGRPQIYDAQQKDFDAVVEFPPSVHLKLDTDGHIKDTVDMALRYIKRL
ncbi:MAG: AAA family ATPase [Syntrophaceae bacterium]|nr:AAA family ATPase [Syntrophaceae bacterium]